MWKQRKINGKNSLRSFKKKQLFMVCAGVKGCELKVKQSCPLGLNSLVLHQPSLLSLHAVSHKQLHSSNFQEQPAVQP